jgi:hypothetical protein
LRREVLRNLKNAPGAHGRYVSLAVDGTRQTQWLGSDLTPSACSRLADGSAVAFLLEAG